MELIGVSKSLDINFWQLSKFVTIGKEIIFKILEVV